jgi:hypothetical protein
VEGRIHAETLVAASGAIAGFSAQQSLLAQLISSNDQATLSQFKVATMKNNERFFFGTPLNNALIGNAETEIGAKLWSLAAGGAVAAGLDISRLPNTDPMFAYVANSVGSDFFPSLSENRPALPAKELLKTVWPLAMKCFNGEISGATAKSGPTSMQWRPVIASYAANTFIRQVKNVLEPAKSLQILMETAIYCSKIDSTAATQVNSGRSH